MSTTSDVTELTDEVLAANFDPGSLSRGRRYANDGMVDVLLVEQGHLYGESEGSRAARYSVDVAWTATPRGIRIAARCSCPVGSNCKHCAALILTARWNLEQGHAPATAGSPAGSIAADPSSTEAADVGTFHPTSNWRRTFDDIRALDDSEDLSKPLAIEFTLSTPKATRYRANPRPVISMRPMRMGAKGRWIKSGVSWSDLGYGYAYALRDVKPSHVTAMRSIAGLTRSGHYGSAQTRDMGDFTAEVWPAVQHAIDAGVTLIPGPGSGSVVELDATPAGLRIDLRADRFGNLVVSAAFDHAILTPGTASDGTERIVGSIGSPIHGLFSFDGSTMTLIALPDQLTPEVSRLVSALPVTIPATDADEFLDVYTPPLATHAAIGSPDGSVTITKSRFDRLVMIIERDSIDSATVYWAARYLRGRTERIHLLGNPSWRGRDRQAELRAAEQLELPGHLLPALAFEPRAMWPIRTHDRDTIVLLNEVVPFLLERGQVAVDVRGNLPELREATNDPLISLSVDDATRSRRGQESDNDWFDLSVEVRVDGEVIGFAELFSALTLGLPTMVLDTGTWLRLDRPEFDKLRELISEARGLADRVGPDGSIAINRFQSSWWSELSKLGVVERQSARWAQSIARMDQATAPTPVSTPDGLKAKLRPYQQQGLDWLAFLHQHELGGILADDMGLGKTIQALALFLHVKERDPDARFLVVTPTSVVENWHREATQFAPDLAVRTITESNKRRGTTLAEAIGNADIVVTSYALFRIEFDDYDSMEWNIAVLDEAQFVKNHKGKTYQCVRQLGARTKLAITGTPLENSLMDLWSLLSITAPGLYPDPKRFSEVYRKPIESGRSADLLPTLRRRIAPLMRRRTKGEVLRELPPKVESVVEVELGPRHSRIYQTQLQRQRQKVLGLVDDMQKNRFEILRSLTLLRQLSLDPGLVDPAHEGVGSAKLDQLMEDVSQVVAEGHKALVFSQFTRFLSRVRGRLDDAGIPYSYLDGRTRRRDAAISRFKDGDAQVFVISLKAGGFGLNLTEADYCFVLDPWWNPAVEAQAVDRTHRMGQQNRVMVYRYVSAGTIEEKVVELQQRKAALFSSVMDADGTLSGALTADDIRGLFD